MTHYRFTDIDPKIEKRVDDLLARMSLRDKVLQMTQVNIQWHGRSLTEERIRQGAGSVLNLYGAANINPLQRLAVEESPHGIPLLLGNDVIHGYRTIFPIPLAWSCTWDPDLIEAGARIAAEEAAADGTNWIFGPVIDICRDPRWGRIAEGAGEDPFLGQAMARALVRGFQSQLSSGRRIVACPKHFAAYGATEDGRDYNTVDMSERALRDIYLPPFKAAFDEGAGSLMSSFNEISGVPTSANTHLLRGILRDEWGYSGVVLSDWNAIAELIMHGVAEDFRDAGRLAALAGVDMDMVSDCFHDHLVSLVEEGSVPMARVEDATRRLLRLKFSLGLFENPYVDEETVVQSFLKPEYRETALEMAGKSMVLLQNKDNLLPIDTQKVKKIALLGPLAEDHHEILGCWYRIGRDEDTECLYEGLEAALPGVEIVTAAGCDIDGQAEPDFNAALDAAESADLVILALGEAEEMSGEAHSRANLDLPGNQQAFLEAVVATGKPVVVVLFCGRPLAIPWIAENAGAILLAWHGGIRTGRAAADLLVGAANPSGKLTATWPRSVGQVPIYSARKSTGRPVGGAGTLQFDVFHFTEFIDESNEPLYPFGYGLSYTEYSYSDLIIETPEVGLEGNLVVSALISNSGDRAGEEIVQLYVRDLVGEVTRPVKELKGFQRIALEPGESRRVVFNLPVSSLGFHGLDLTYKVEPGRFMVWIGPDAGQGLAGEFMVSS